MEVSVRCPKCKNIFAKCNNDDNLHKKKCNKCGKWIWWRYETQWFEIHDVEPRNSSSGKRFY